MKEKLMRFMQGRYGADQFTRFLLGVSFTLLLISIFAKGRGNLFYFFAVAVMVYTYFRIFSKNFQKRYEENQQYLRYSYKGRVWLDQKKKILEQSKQYHIYKCPTCKQKIRIPRGKGKVAISCPKCHNEFMKRS